MLNTIVAQNNELVSGQKQVLSRIAMIEEIVLRSVARDMPHDEGDDNDIIDDDNECDYDVPIDVEEDDKTIKQKWAAAIAPIKSKGCVHKYIYIYVYIFRVHLYMCV
jgi:hypothetical protein